MHDLALLGFIGALIMLGLRKPFIFVLGYTYIDIVSPQRLSYYLLNSIPVSLIFFALALGGFLAVDDKKGTRLAGRQVIMILLLLWCAFTTFTADFPLPAAEKWAWVWKALVFAIFLPFTLRTRLRIEGLLLFMVLSASSIIVTGGMKTMIGGGGYGTLNLGLSDNSGLYEGSTISTVAIAIIPTILFLARYGTVFPRDWKVRLYSIALVFACLLIPIGTVTRTGLICIGLVALMGLRDSKRRLLYIAGMGVALMVAIPFLPASYTQRMHTIQGYQADESASTRVAVWGWTWNYVQSHPAGGGFNAYLGNHIKIELKDARGQPINNQVEYDKARAFHSAYFEMLGEQGFPGFLLWAALHLSSLFRLEMLRRRFRRSTDPDEEWIAPLATALQHGHIIYLVGSLFIGIAFQPFVYMMIASEIGLDSYVKRTRPLKAKPPMGQTVAQMQAVPA
ncbi:putative O-glycosylation ligase, exosortase A system-associated [Sphingomonas sp. CGMCC 1.13654]|uniref:Putative O-glycosylation ligase, exosortase A system-associated n=1 Tax=Sphingomonas chungangi TaxID=2683589 RepID=A0A838L022_9SPHN|nr:putative O-glycosylation ligase, exosortase A system-associated [Sphingomonas chungangi]MBA2932853.1 putative O-glycosylation ligase, exosortase A system-associated [Sphingomonas chungangi]MVW56474.1 putative O-glycosylation ligase, exosortase A system-associated [Sphingomonas chungangi]